MFAFVVILASLAISAVSGLTLDSCNGPYHLPLLLDVITRPSYDHLNRVKEVDCSIGMRSKVPVYIEWRLLESSTSDIPVMATEDNQDLQSSFEAHGDQFLFKLRVRLQEPMQNIADLSKLIDVRFFVVFDCNNVTFGGWLGDFIEANRRKAWLPGIAELPKAQYPIGDEGLRGLLRTVFFPYGANTPPPDISMYCYKAVAERKNGELSFVGLPFSVGNQYHYDSWDKKRGDLDVTTVTCEVNVEEGLEARYVNVVASVTLAGPQKTGDPQLELSLYLGFVVGFRKPGVDYPVVLVKSGESRPLTEHNPGLVLLTEDDAMEIVCYAEAASTPSVDVARVNESGNYVAVPLSKKRLHSSLVMAKFEVKSPPIMKEEEYICSARSGLEVASEKFKLLRYSAVQIESDKAVSMDELDQPFNLSCEATGAPRPTIQFYGLIYPDAHTYGSSLKDIKDYKLEDSDIFEISTWVEGSKTHGRITVKDIGKLRGSLPSYFERYNKSYEVVCVAFNDYSESRKFLGHL